MSTHSAAAWVKVTLEIDAGTSWTPDRTVEEIKDQAGREAVLRLMNILSAAKISAQIVGEPKVTTIIYGEK